MVHCSILQKGDGALHFSSTCCWDPDTDGSTTVKFENDYLYCFVTLFAVIY